MAAAITRNGNERAQLTTYRMIFSFSGGMVVNAVMLPLVYWYSDGAKNQVAGYQFAIAVLAVLSVIF